MHFNATLARAAPAAFAVLTIAGLWGCGSNDALLNDSTAAVLVPADSKFRDSLMVDSAGSANNYLVRSNWSADFDPTIDTALVIESYQINDVTIWTGDRIADDPLTAAAYSAVLADSVELAPGGPCEVAVTEPLVVSCTYPSFENVPFSILVRRFETSYGPSVMLVFEGMVASHDFIAGAFNEESPRAVA